MRRIIPIIIMAVLVTPATAGAFTAHEPPKASASQTDEQYQPQYGFTTNPRCQNPTYKSAYTPSGLQQKAGTHIVIRRDVSDVRSFYDLLWGRSSSRFMLCSATVVDMNGNVWPNPNPLGGSHSLTYDKPNDLKKFEVTAIKVPRSDKGRSCSYPRYVAYLDHPNWSKKGNVRQLGFKFKGTSEGVQFWFKASAKVKGCRFYYMTRNGQAKSVALRVGRIFVRRDQSDPLLYAFATGVIKLRR